MKKLGRFGIAAAALAMLTACGGSEEGQGGLTAQENRDLDNAASMLDAETLDASPDSLVADENAFDAELEGLEEPADPAANAQ